MNVDIFVEPYGNDRYAARLYVNEAHVLLGVTDTKAAALAIAVGFGDSTVVACVKAVDRYGENT